MNEFTNGFISLYVKMRRVKAYEFTCPECGKTILSLSERQIFNLARIHLLKHKPKGRRRYVVQKKEKVVLE
jgi:PHP family Zn ribbon phosphoesterase